MGEDEKAGTRPAIDAATLKQWIREGRKFRLIDIRSPEQHAAGHIPGAQNEFINAALKQGDEKAVDRIETGDGIPIVTVCNQGGSCRIASDLLRKKGVEAYALEGGMKAWLTAGNPAETASKTGPE
ncbi:MAG: rhodanese-like domain-containing protein [Fibrobacteres bacterium]|jgi:rhodanese-related sulfurtransferase|nr:rhodanese-like domain-containing protein [Fibrobacterota bacterium]